jgi:hypothetical protein
MPNVPINLTRGLEGPARRGTCIRTNGSLTTERNRKKHLRMNRLTLLKHSSSLDSFDRQNSTHTHHGVWFVGVKGGCHCGNMQSFVPPSHTDIGQYDYYRDYAKPLQGERYARRMV